MSNEGKVLNISHIHINSQDIARSIEFYKLLGFRVERVIGDDPKNPADKDDPSTLPFSGGEHGRSRAVGMGLSDDPRATTRLEIMEWVEPQKKTSEIDPEDRLGAVRIALSVKGLAQIIEKVKAAGFAVGEMDTVKITPTLSSAYAHLRDPDGSWLSLMEWIKAKA